LRKRRPRRAEPEALELRQPGAGLLAGARGCNVCGMASLIDKIKQWLGGGKKKT
jgi:hypothetical protein